MKLKYFQGNPPNFGDELNASMWKHLLPSGFLDQDEKTLFIGIGSIIEPGYPNDARKIVVGSGYGGYTRLPDVHDGNWDFRFVRGPQTTEALGIDPALAIADSAILLRATPLPKPTKGIGTAFIPHYESIDRGNWRHVCKLAGVHFIDPTLPTKQVISEIMGADLVIAEAMHGAIVSDALRTPWIGVRTMHKVHRFKWMDWARALDIDYRPEFLFPSNLRETWATSTGRSGSGARAVATLDSAIAAPLNAGLAHIAANSMQKLARLEPTLSPDKSIGRATDRALGAIRGMVKEYATRCAAE